MDSDSDPNTNLRSISDLWLYISMGEGRDLTICPLSTLPSISLNIKGVNGTRRVAYGWRDSDISIDVPSFKEETGLNKRWKLMFYC